MFEPVEAINPILGMRIKDCDDLSPESFTDNELVKAINDLSATRHDYDMLLESATFEEVDEYWNPGTEEVPVHYVLEAIVVDKFSRTDHRMAAVVRVLNKHLGDSEINALDPIVGKPKKTGSFAYVTVQLPFSDGQVVSVIFHSPEGDKKKIGPSDQIIAFRWLLNKRDITAVVAPEEGTEVSLETIAKRLTQLVVKNSKRFESTQKQAQAERQELENLKNQVKEAEDRQRELIETIGKAQKDADSMEAELSNTLTLLEKQKTINAELQAMLDALKKAKDGGRSAGAGNAGNGNGNNGGNSGTGNSGTSTPGNGTNPAAGGDAGNGGATGAEPAFVAHLQDIVTGKYDADTAKCIELIENAINEAEKAGLLEDYDALLNNASNHLTELLAKEAA